MLAPSPASSPTPACTASTQAAPPTSAMRAPSVMSAISSADLTVRIHIAAWAVAERLIGGASEVLVPGAPLILYGPFSREGDFAAFSNVAFDRTLRAENPDWGIRDLDTEVRPLAEAGGFRLAAVHRMPANNLTVVFR